MKRIGLVCIISIIVDQIIKFIIKANMNIADTINIIPNFFRITFLKNEGAAFSILSGNRLLFIFITVLVLILFYFFLLKNKKIIKTKQLLYGLLLGGIIGNFIDRILYGYVIDYLDFNIGEFNYPVFNIADSLIVISIIWLIVLSVKEDKNESRRW